MRRIWSGHVADGNQQRRDLLELAFGDIGAYAVAEAFFATCKTVGELDDGEGAIWAKLRKEVNDEISERNNIAHGDWLIGFWTSGTDEPFPVRLVRIKASSQTKPFDQRELTTDQLDEIASRVEHLASIVWQFGLACTHLGAFKARVSEVIQMTEDGHLVQPEGAVWVLPNPHGP